MKMTLLEMVQDILNAMDSDNVNSISDTEESQQVAQTIKTSYYDLVTDREWSWLKQETNLTGLVDTDNPTKMQISDGISKIYWIRYNKKDVSYLTSYEFRKTLDSRDTSLSNVDADGFVTDTDPTYWTSFDDTYVVFDSYDSVSESTLQESKSKIYALVFPTWTASDSFTPSLPDSAFPALLAEAKATCFINFKQQANAREEKKAFHKRTGMQHTARKLEETEEKTTKGIDYGR